MPRVSGVGVTVCPWGIPREIPTRCTGCELHACDTYEGMEVCSEPAGSFASVVDRGFMLVPVPSGPVEDPKGFAENISFGGLGEDVAERAYWREFNAHCPKPGGEVPRWASSEACMSRFRGRAARMDEEAALLELQRHAWHTPFCGPPDERELEWAARANIADALRRDPSADIEELVDEALPDPEGYGAVQGENDACEAWHSWLERPWFALYGLRRLRELRSAGLKALRESSEAARARLARCDSARWLPPEWVHRLDFIRRALSLGHDPPSDRVRCLIAAPAAPPAVGGPPVLAAPARTA